MKNTEMKVVKFNNEDVIATSGVKNEFLMSGWGNDGDRTNDMVGGVNFLNSDGSINYTGLTAAVQKATGDKTASVKTTTRFQSPINASSYSMSGMQTNGGGKEYNSFNGVKYYFNTSDSKFYRI